MAARNAIPAHKRVPYLPELVKTGELAGQPRMRENLNGIPFAEATEDSAHADETVSCRHLALSYIEDRKFLDLAAQNPRDLRKYYSGGKLEAVAQRAHIWRGSPPEAWQAVGNRKFGHWLAAIAKEMERTGKTCAEAVLIFPTVIDDVHVLAVRIQRKSREGGGYIRISAYDPSGIEPGGTGNHKALEVTRPKDLLKHSLQDFFTAFGSEPDLACVAAICPDLPLPADGELPYLGQGSSKRSPPPEWADAIYAVVIGGLREPLLALCKRLASRGVTGSAVLPVLHNPSNPPLLLAASTWRPGLFETFAEAMLLLGVRGPETLPVLLSTHRKGFSSLYFATEKTTAAFADFAQAMVRLAIPRKKALAALANQAPGVPSALVEAVLRSDPCAFVDFAKALQILNVRGAKALPALLAKDAAGVSTLHCAVEIGNTAAFVDFAQALLDLGVRGGRAVSALLNKNDEGFSALHVALDDGHTAAFVDFAEALRHLGIQGTEALDALLDRGRDGFSTLDHAVDQGFPAAFVDFAQALVRLGITGEAALAGLGARTQGLPALWRAAEQKVPDAFVHFAKALQILGITGERARQALLSTAEDGSTAVDLVRTHKEHTQVKDLWDALAVLREPPA